MRVTRKMMNDNSVYNINANKEYMDKVNTKMATQKKFVDPSDDPITAVRALRFRSNLTEVTQYLDRNVSDAVSWTGNTQTSIDSAKEIMRSLKAEYTSAANGTNESKDQRIYYENMKNLVDEYFSIGNASTEDRHLFTGYRTQDSLTFTDDDFDVRGNSVENGKFNYVAIRENFDIDDIEGYSYTVKTDGSGTSEGSSGITDDDITALASGVNETLIEKQDVFRLRLSYEELDSGDKQLIYQKDSSGTVVPAGENYKLTIYGKDGITKVAEYKIDKYITYDTELGPKDFEGKKVYLNTTTGNLLFGEDLKKDIAKYLSEGNSASFSYNKTGDNWHKGDAKPEYYFDCFEIGLGTTKDKAITYDDHQQSMYYHMGDSQNIKVNANACDVFTLDARRDLDEIHDYLNLLDGIQSKVDRLMEMQSDTEKYNEGQQGRISDLLAAATKELEYAQNRVNEAFSSGMTRAGKYFDFVNAAATEMGTSVKRLELIKNRLTQDKTTVQTQTSNNENIDLSVLTVDLSEASLSYSAALQVTGKISQQTLVSYI